MRLYHSVMSPNDADGMANSVDSDQTEQSDLGLHCLPRHICPKTQDHNGTSNKMRAIHLSSQTRMVRHVVEALIAPKGKTEK